MTREELEKMFDEIIISSEFSNPNIELSNSFKKEIKQFIFETMIPEVIREILSFDFHEEKFIAKWEWIAIQEIKSIAKKLYNITL